MIKRVGNLDEVKANFSTQAKCYRVFPCAIRGLRFTQAPQSYRDNSDIGCFWFCFFFVIFYSFYLLEQSPDGHYMLESMVMRFEND